MEPLLSREAAREIDRDAVERLGIPSLSLMEHAGTGAFEAIVARFSSSLARVVIVAGPGQNGGDGWVVARHLFERGQRPIPVLVGSPDRVRGDAAMNLERLRVLGLEPEHVDPDAASHRLPTLLEGATLVVDALFGTGLDRPIVGGYADAILAIDRSEVPCVALDLPSGVDANTGQVLGVAPHAMLTTTFAGQKCGLHQFPGVAHAGETVVIDIGAPAPTNARWTLTDAHDLRTLLSPRPDDAHKGTAGHLLVIGGSPGRSGAAALAALGALRTGAGLVTIATRASARSAMDAKVLEAMTIGLEEPAARATDEALAAIDERGGAVIGPGLGLDDFADTLAMGVVLAAPRPVVLDADALTVLAREGLESLRAAKGPRVLTPHPGEASRLLGIPTTDVQRDRYAAATALATRSGHVAILKGARTVIASPDGRGWVARVGTPALGVAGTGDVLAGIVGASLLADPDIPRAALTAVLLHGRAGERAARGDRGLLAHEVADAVPDVVTEALFGVDGRFTQ
jgi:NAD(P)H-hydrate epimerase